MNRFIEPDDPLSKAITTGNVDELTKYYQEHGSFPTYESLYFHLMYNQPDSICFLHKHGVTLPSDVLTIVASWEKTTVDHLRYLYERGFMWNDHTMVELVIRNNVDGIEYLHKQGCPLGKGLLKLGYNISIECLRYLHENGCDWDSKMIVYAIRNGNYETLKYAHQHGCPLTDIKYNVNSDLNVLFTKFLGSVEAHRITFEIQMCLEYVRQTNLLSPII